MSSASGPVDGCGHDEREIDIRSGPSIPQGYVSLDYGTSGFRGLVDTPPKHLDHVVYRCGLLMAALPFLRNPARLYDEETDTTAKDGEHTPLSGGVLITASHNEAGENGLKILESDGNMLNPAWEGEFNDLINFRGQLSHAVARLFDKYGIRLLPLRRNSTQYIILIGYDTRVSSPRLSALFIEGVRAMAEVMKLQGTTCVELGVVTSPTLGYLLNNSMLYAVNDEPYVKGLKDAFYTCLSSFIDMGHVKRVRKTDPQLSLFYDCSYGVGGHVIYKFFDCLRELGIIPHLCHSPIWLDESNQHLLNNGCGAYHVLSMKRPPVKIESVITLYEGKWFCSFDGDADRLVYFMPHKGSIRLIDGIRLLVLKMKFLGFVFERMQVNKGDIISIAVMLNHYANGAALKYIKRSMEEWSVSRPGVKWSMELCRVGVKNMQEKVPNYDISICYEANGHGNFVFNKECSLFRTDEGCSCAYRRLLANVAKMFLSPIGDAIANTLFIQLAMKVMRYTFEDVMELYEEMPYVNATVPFHPSKRGIFRTNAESDIILEEPAELQRLVIEAAAKVDGGRAFIRPSGTEPLCRVYAEAPSEAQAKKLADDIAAYVKRFV